VTVMVLEVEPSAGILVGEAESVETDALAEPADTVNEGVAEKLPKPERLALTVFAVPEVLAVNVA
jgi:hypothetical protein